MRKLEIGNNNARIDDTWETLDIVKNENTDIVADICDSIPIDDETYDLIYMSHVLEHIPWYETVNVLTELYRVLKPDGRLEIYVPDIDKLIEAYHKKSVPDGWYRFNDDKDPFIWFSGRLYTYGDNPSDFHKAAFNQDHLTKCLKKAGFNNTRKIHKPRGYDHGYINLGMVGIK